MNRDIYMLDLIQEQAVDQENDQEKHDISDLPGDDDFGDIEAEFEDF